MKDGVCQLGQGCLLLIIPSFMVDESSLGRSPRQSHIENTPNAHAYRAGTVYHLLAAEDGVDYTPGFVWGILDTSSAHSRYYIAQVCADHASFTASEFAPRFWSLYLIHDLICIGEHNYKIATRGKRP